MSCWESSDPVYRSTGLITINGVSTENEPDWSGFTWNARTLSGSVDPDSRDAFLAAIEDGREGAFPVTFYACAQDGVTEPHLPGPLVTVEDGGYLIHGEERLPFGHGLPACSPLRHYSVVDWIEWSYSGSDPAMVGRLSHWHDRATPQPVMRYLGFHFVGEPMFDRADADSVNASSIGLQLTIPDEAHQAIYVWVGKGSGGAPPNTVEWRPAYENGNPSSASPHYAFTLLDDETWNVGDVRDFSIWRLLDPVAPTGPNPAVYIDGIFTFGSSAAAIVVRNVDTAGTPNDAPVFATGTGSTASNSLSPGAGDLVLECSYWAQNNQPVGNSLVAGDQALAARDFIDRPAGQPDQAIACGYGSGGSPAWTLYSSQKWASYGIVVHGLP